MPSTTETQAAGMWPAQLVPEGSERQGERWVAARALSANHRDRRRAQLAAPQSHIYLTDEQHDRASNGRGSDVFLPADN